MQIFFLLTLAHFVGDYPLQTNWVYEQKRNGLVGGVVHATGLLLGLVACLLPYLYEPRVWLAIACIVLVHYFQDAYKIFYIRKAARGEDRLSYGLDQVGHICFSLIFWYALLFPILSQLEPIFFAKIYSNLPLILFLNGLVIVTYVFDVTQYIFDSERRKYDIRDWRFMFVNAIIYTALFILFVLMFQNL